MVQTSFRNAAAIPDVLYTAFGCQAKGWRKPALVRQTFRKCDYVVWLDSDIVVDASFRTHEIESLFNETSADTETVGAPQPIADDISPAGGEGDMDTPN